MLTANRKLEAGNQKMQNSRQAAILRVMSMKINRLLPMTTINVHMKFDIETPKRTWLTFQKPCCLQSPEPKKTYGHQAAILKMTLLKINIGSCLWPPSICIWNFKLKFQSKLDLWSRNHVVYRQTDGRTDGQGESSIPPSNFVGRGYNNMAVPNMAGFIISVQATEIPKYCAT